jgi:hypothetical protein
MKIIAFLLLVMIAFSCHKPVAAANNAKLDELADRTCQAISIRQQRFALANKIRFTQDSLTNLKLKGDSRRLQARLKDYMLLKDSLLKSSLAMADNIRLQLDSLVPYGDKGAQKRFTATLDSLLAKKGCMAK